ncbi:hypothetical protein CcaCcLH18_04536 [Colletotrichum camelliae]|nr:hypothetical protein CcaCcLH18_04536 [Colletotrichum camelliae]
MTTSRHQRSQQRLVQLLFLASASTAAIISIGGTDLTLSNFQLLTQLSIPLGCLLTYNNPIQGCTANDFSSTGTCSVSCRRGLLLMQTNIQDVCHTDGPADFHRDSAAAIIDRCRCASASASYHRPSRHPTPGDYINSCTTAKSTARCSSGQHGGATSIITAAACGTATASTHDRRHVYDIQRGSTAEHVG